MCLGLSIQYRNDINYVMFNLIQNKQPQLILQELDESSMPYTNAEDKSLFVRRWNPATYTLSHLQEITVTMKEGSKFESNTLR